jgi:hypothetical protein
LASAAQPEAGSWLRQLIAEQRVEPDFAQAPIGQMLIRWRDALKLLPDICRGIDNLAVMLACVAHTPGADEYRRGLREQHESLVNQRLNLMKKINDRQRQFAVAQKNILRVVAEFQTKQVASESRISSSALKELVGGTHPPEVVRQMFPCAVESAGLPAMRPIVLEDVEDVTTIGSAALPLTAEQTAYVLTMNGCGYWMRAMLAVLISKWEAHFDIVARPGGKYSCPGMESGTLEQAQAYYRLIKFIRRDAVNAALSLNSQKAKSDYVTVAGAPLVRTSVGIMVTHTVYMRIQQWVVEGEKQYQKLDSLNAQLDHLVKALKPADAGSEFDIDDERIDPAYRQLYVDKVAEIRSHQRKLRDVLSLNRGWVSDFRPGSVSFDACWGAITSTDTARARKLLVGQPSEVDTPFSWLSQALVTGAIVPAVCTFIQSNDRSLRQIKAEGSSGTTAPYISNVVVVPGSVLPRNVKVTTVAEKYPKATLITLVSSTAVPLFDYIRVETSVLGMIAKKVVGVAGADKQLADYVSAEYGVGGLLDPAPQGWMKSVLNKWAVGWRSSGNTRVAEEHSKKVSAYGPAERSLLLTRAFGALTVQLLVHGAIDGEGEVETIEYGRAFWVDYGSSLSVAPSRAQFMVLGNNGVRVFMARERLAGHQLSRYTTESVALARVLMYRELGDTLIALSAQWPDHPLRLGEDKLGPVGPKVQ